MFFGVLEIGLSVDWFGEGGGVFDLDIWGLVWFCVDILC